MTFTLNENIEVVFKSDTIYSKYTLSKYSTNHTCNELKIWCKATYDGAGPN